MKNDEKKKRKNELHEFVSCHRISLIGLKIKEKKIEYIAYNLLNSSEI